MWLYWHQFSSVQSLRFMSDSLWPHGLQHARPPCPSTTPGVYSNSCPLRWWCHPAISSSVISVSSCLQSFPASGSFLVSQFFTSGGQIIGVSASASVLPGLISFRTDWFDLAVQGTLKNLQHHISKASILQCSAFFIVQLSHSYMTTGKTIALTRGTFVDVLAYLRIVHVWFQTTAIKTISQLSKSQFFFVSSAYKFIFTLYHSLLHVQKHYV